MNLRDSEIVQGLLKKHGYIFTDDDKEADIIILNTCAVRQHAEDRVWSEIGSYTRQDRLKRGKKQFIGLIGCMAQSHKENAFARAENLSFVVGPGDIGKIPEILENLFQAELSLYEKRIWETDNRGRAEEIYHTNFYQDKKHSYVVISEGCSNYCSYCVVPFVRGNIRHRKKDDILEEIGSAVENGISEITLLGQNVNAYADKSCTFPKLLGLIDSISGLNSFGFLTSHPKDTNQELFAAIAGLKKIKKNLHLPLQSGSNRILKLMNRGYTREAYAGLIKDFRKTVKNGIVTTDVIVGFPTESDADFQDTLELFKEIEFAAAYLFKYSPRPGTVSSKMPDDVPKAIKEERHHALLEIQRKNSKKYKW